MLSPPTQEQRLRSDLEVVGFELLDDQRSQLIKKVKTLLLEKVPSGELPEDLSLVKFVGAALHCDYRYFQTFFQGGRPETVDIILADRKSSDVIGLVNFSKITYRKMVQNLFWATGYNVVAIPPAAGVLLSAICAQPCIGGDIDKLEHYRGGGECSIVEKGFRSFSSYRKKSNQSVNRSIEIMED